MKIFLDTNILLDILQGNTRPNYTDSARLLSELKKQHEIQALVSVQTIIDVSYCMTRHKDTEKDFYNLTSKLLEKLYLVTISPEDLNRALASHPEDFEDEAQLRCAQTNDCSYFITGDTRLLKIENKEKLRFSSPGDFLKLASQS